MLELFEDDNDLWDIFGLGRDCYERRDDEISSVNFNKGKQDAKSLRTATQRAAYVNNMMDGLDEDFNKLCDNRTDLGGWDSGFYSQLKHEVKVDINEKRLIPLFSGPDDELRLTGLVIGEKEAKSTYFRERKQVQRQVTRNHRIFKEIMASQQTFNEFCLYAFKADTDFVLKAVEERRQENNPRNKE